MTSLRARLVLIYVGFVFLILAAVSAALLLGYRSDLRLERDQRLAVESHYLFNLATRALNSRSDPGAALSREAQESLRLAVQISHGSVYLRDEAGTVLMADAELEAAARHEGIAPESMAEGITRTIEAGDLKGTLAVIRDQWGKRFLIGYALGWGPYGERYDRAALYLRLIVLLGTACSFVLAYLFLSRALRPVQAMSRRAEEINAGNLRAHIFVPRDGSEFAHLARVLNSMLDRIDSSFNTLRTFLADASHELKSPLTRIRLRLESMLKEERAPDELRHSVAQTLEDVAAAGRLVSNLLLLSQIQSGLKKERIDAAKLTRDVAETGKLLCENSGIDLRLSLKEGTSLAGDPDALRSCLANVLNNAIEHTPKGGLIRLELDGSLSRVTWVIADTGPGVPEQVMRKLWERFNRGGGPGTGLGLSIVKSIVDAHRGEVSIARGKEGGTTVTISLPANPD